MAFTEATLQAQLDSDGLACRITAFNVAAATTDVYVQNVNSTSRKAGWTQIANTQTASQAATSVRANLSA